MGGYYPPPTGVPPAGQYPGPPGQYPPPNGNPPSEAPGTPPAGGRYSPPASVYQMPSSASIYSVAQSSYQPGYYPAPPGENQWYLGTAIPDPHTPPAPHGVQKVPGYDPALTFNVVVEAINSSNDAQCQFLISRLSRIIY